MECHIIGNSLNIHDYNMNMNEFIANLNKTKNILGSIDSNKEIVITNIVNEDR